MPMIKKMMIMGFLFLTRSMALGSNPAGEGLADLEFYGTINSCLQQYISCKNTVATTNPDIDCLQWGKCQHLTTLDALIQIPYIKNILANNSQLNTNVTNILIKYGKNQLSKQVNTYNNENITTLLTELVSELNNQDPAILAGAGISINSLANNTYQAGQ